MQLVPPHTVPFIFTLPFSVQAQWELMEPAAQLWGNWR